jgi:hypothetical protein
VLAQQRLLESSMQTVLRTRRLFTRTLVSFVGLRSVCCLLIEGLDETTGRLVLSPDQTDRMGRAVYIHYALFSVYLFNSDMSVAVMCPLSLQRINK